MIVLGIETSCDETAAAIVHEDRTILSNLVVSQMEDHRPFGGVVPEIAARSHLNHIDGLVKRALAEAAIAFKDLDGIAATGGPGLIGGVLVGMMTAKAIALVHDRPLIAVNHLEGHALTARLTNGLEYPYLLLLVSGGHCQLLAVSGPGAYRRYGTTLDDAVGEAFDKTAKLIGLPYPGGPAIEQAAKYGQADRYPFPRPMLGRPNCNFSFSGLKTAVARTVQNTRVNQETVANIAASFQMAVGEALEDRTRNALQRFKTEYPAGTTLVVAGGVAANAHLRAVLAALAAEENFWFVAPPPDLCTDNAAMIAWAGIERLQQNLTDTLDFAPRPRWPLEDLVVIS